MSFKRLVCSARSWSSLFKWAGLVMLLVAGVVSVSTNSNDTLPWMQAIMTSQRCVRIIQVGMVLFLLFFAHYVGVSGASIASVSHWGLVLLRLLS